MTKAELVLKRDTAVMAAAMACAPTAAMIGTSPVSRRSVSSILLSAHEYVAFPALQIDPTNGTDEAVQLARQDSGVAGLVKCFDLFATSTATATATPTAPVAAMASGDALLFTSGRPSLSAVSCIKTRSQTKHSFTCSLPRAPPAGHSNSNKRRRSLTSQYNATYTRAPTALAIPAASSLFPALSISPTPSACSSPNSITSSQSSPLPSPPQARREISSLARLSSAFVSQQRSFRSLVHDLSPSPSSPYVGSRVSPSTSPWPLSPQPQFVQRPQPANFTFSLTPTPSASPANGPGKVTDPLDVCTSPIDSFKCTSGGEQPSPSASSSSGSTCSQLATSDLDDTISPLWYRHQSKLPVSMKSADGIQFITPSTLAELLRSFRARQESSAFHDLYDLLHVFDCRFPYEFDGGHIEEAVNITEFVQIQTLLLQSPAIAAAVNHTEGLDEFDSTQNPSPPPCERRKCLIFHCEFSQSRAPFYYTELRRFDRSLHGFPPLTCSWPEMYVLQGGYQKFVDEFATLCSPCGGYVAMRDKRWRRECGLGLKLRKIEKKNQQSAMRKRTSGGGIDDTHTERRITRRQAAIHLAQSQTQSHSPQSQCPSRTVSATAEVDVSAAHAGVTPTVASLFAPAPTPYP